jgi:tripartite-type tricarboxylate transporter receptor subunit TctC
MKTIDSIGRNQGRRQWLRAVGTLAAAGSIAGAATGQARYPTRSIRFIVPYAPGGGTDILARTIAPRLSSALGQPVVVENRAGAGGNIGADLVAKSPADGYTLLLGANTMPINASLQKLPFDLIKDFTAVGMMASAPMALVVHPSVAARTVQEFVALAKASPGKLNYANPGNGTPQHLASALFSQMAGIDITQVLYKGGGPALNDLVGGQTQASFLTLASVKQHIEAGRLRALAVAPAARSRAMPELPTVAEAGLPGYAVDLWYGVFGPAGLPAEIVAALNESINSQMLSAEVQERMKALGFETWTGAPALLADQLRRDLVQYADIVKRGNIRPEQ